MPKATRETILAAVLTNHKPDLPAVPSEVAISSTGLALAQITERQRKTMEARMVFVREIERLASVVGKEAVIRNMVRAAREERLAPHLQALVHVANDRPGKRADRGLSRRGLYQWCSLYASGGVAALVPMHKQRDMGIPPWANAFLSLYQTPQHPTVADCLRRMKWAGERPSIFTVYRFLAKIGLPSRMAGRATGNALLKMRPHKIRITDNLLPGDVYTADGTTFDAEIQNPLDGQAFKPEVTLVLDVATRRCVGVSVGHAESALTILDALRIACCFGGVPAMLYCDNGSGYKNKLLLGEGQGMLARLGVEMVNSIPQRPQGKGLMERAVQTICTPLSKRLPSCTHADMDRDTAKKVYRITRKDLKIKGRSDLLPTWPEFLKLLAAGIDEYNSTAHRALPMTAGEDGKRRHMSPDECWRNFEARGWEPCRVPEKDREDLFMPGARRVVRNGVVKLFNGEYFAPDLEEFHGATVDVRYDIWDSQHVHVWTTRGEKICTAELNAHAIPYFPASQVEAARAKRQRGQVSRLARKIEAVAPGARVELPEPCMPLTVADGVCPDTAMEAAEIMERARADEKAVQAEFRPVFQHSYEKYEWLMCHREQWTGADVDWLQSYVRSEEYADLHDNYRSLGLAWPQDTAATAG